ncbi:MAG: OmpA family protein [bacterium]|jgi:OOP family OmpA-OmpF porin
MNRSYLLLCGLVAFIAAGCSTAQLNPESYAGYLSTVQYQEPMAVSPVVPNPGEQIIVDTAVILADSSGSMRNPDQYPVEKALIESFVAAMPNGSYNAGIYKFGKRGWEVHDIVPFDRASMAESANFMLFNSGLTPLDEALNKANFHMPDSPGTIAVIVFSDGVMTSEVAAYSAAQRFVSEFIDVCFYTVQVGHDPDGERFLRDLAQMTPCGEFVTADQIGSPDSLENFVRRIFFGGCPDSDGDGVCDEDDECPDTPRGVPVDARGCPEEEPTIQVPPQPCPDSDGDGVCDEDDECPDTPRGARVDERGCWVVGDVLFDYDKSNIRPEYTPLLNDVATVLKMNPEIRVRIEGHTDSIASHQYNQRLSERRAQSVYNYLLNTGVDPAMLEMIGYGETRPVAPNTTPENRQLNRRIEFNVIQGPQPRRP